MIFTEEIFINFFFVVEGLFHVAATRFLRTVSISHKVSGGLGSECRVFLIGTNFDIANPPFPDIKMTTSNNVHADLAIYEMISAVFSSPSEGEEKKNGRPPVTPYPLLDCPLEVYGEMLAAPIAVMRGLHLVAAAADDPQLTEVGVPADTVDHGIPDEIVDALRDSDTQVVIAAFSSAQFASYSSVVGQAKTSANGNVLKGVLSYSPSNPAEAAAAAGDASVGVPCCIIKVAAMGDDYEVDPPAVVQKFRDVWSHAAIEPAVIVMIRPPVTCSPECIEREVRGDAGLLSIIRDYAQFERLAETLFTGISNTLDSATELQAIWGSYIPCAGNCRGDLATLQPYFKCPAGHVVCECCCEASNWTCRATVRSNFFSADGAPVCGLPIPTHTSSSAPALEQCAEEEDEAFSDFIGEDEDDVEEDEESSEEYVEETSSRKRNRSKSGRSLCRHRCGNKQTCKHKCCKEHPVVRKTGKSPSIIQLSDADKDALREEERNRRVSQFQMLNPDVTLPKRQRKRQKAGKPKLSDFIVTNSDNAGQEEEEGQDDANPPPPPPPSQYEYSIFTHDGIFGSIPMPEEPAMEKLCLTGFPAGDDDIQRPYLWPLNYIDE